MRRTRPLLTALAFTLSVLGHSYSFAQEKPDDEPIVWEVVGNWAIMVDSSLGYYCYAAVPYENSVVFRLGFQGGDSDAPMYVAIGSPNWSSIEVGKDYDILLQLDNESPWPSPTRGIHINGVPFLAVNTDRIDFVDQVMRKHSLKVHFNGSIIANLNLRGSFAALRSLGTCQTEVEKIREKSTPSDPFSGVSAPTSPTDPFDL